MPATPTPTTQEIRDAVTIIHHGIHNPDADPVAISAAHAKLARARHTAEPPVAGWLDTYLDPSTTANGPAGFRRAVNTLARHFKLPPPAPPTPPLTPGEQGRLFD